VPGAGRGHCRARAVGRSGLARARNVCYEREDACYAAGAPGYAEDILAIASGFDTAPRGLVTDPGRIAEPDGHGYLGGRIVPFASEMGMICKCTTN
jgi:hypothetical protein